ncbi:hypothetical protein LS73_002840 [Helicobacter muridarum]|uniref:Uncharacterized protein n=1 Tax=Helicobacter muridarum TaxID=216 RepID=A0A099TX18_9HELI|nr:flagellar FLiS export co-chaperone [Helicobacter muridarum]TLE00856.1 hypothetical protein LS73_002840 [Helicobacter muridarum]STQ86624.1 Uncharacterised protein [Helicobacter muridarum]
MDKMLQTFKKHLNGLDNIEDIMLNAKKQNKIQIYRFGEGIKAANELIGCLQVLSARLNKLQIIASKIEFSLEDDPSNPANINMSEILLSQARDLVINTRFIDKDLFDSKLSASMYSSTIDFEIENPISFLEKKEFNEFNEYINSKKEEIRICMEQIRKLSEQGASVSDDVSIESSTINLRGKTIGEALRISSLS